MNMYKFLIPKLRKIFGGYGLRKNRFVVWLVNLLKPKKVTVDGHIFYLNKHDNTILEDMISGSYEPDETALFKKIIHQGDIVVDIGANIGYYTLLFARAVGKDGMVYAFEPDPTNFRILQKNIKVNGYNNVRAFQYAVSDSSRKGFLYLNDYNTGDHRIFDPTHGRESVPIEIISLDEKFPDLRPNFVKIDTQGAEVGILRGMKKTIESVSYLSVEYWPYGLKKAEATGEDLRNVLTNYGFVYDLDPTLYTVENQQFTNLLVRRK